MQISRTSTLLLLLILSFNAFSAQPDTAKHEETFRIPTFPDVPSTVEHGDALLIQLAAPIGSVRFRTPVDFYVRFVNVGTTSIYLPLSENYASGMDIRLRWSAENERSSPKGYVWGGGIQGADLILLPQQHATICVHDKLLPPGTHKVTVVYLSGSNEKGISTGKTESNPVKVIVEDKQPTPNEIQDLTRQFEELSNYMSSSQYDETPWLSGMVERRMMLGSPYSVPFLKKQLEQSRSRLMRAHAAEILAAIADKERSQPYGFARDTTAKELILTQVTKEPDARVLRSLISAMGSYSDVLSVQERTTLRSSLIGFLNHVDSEIRFFSALQLIRMYPNDDEARETIQRHLKRPDFLSESLRATLIGYMSNPLQNGE